MQAQALHRGNGESNSGARTATAATIDDSNRQSPGCTSAVARATSLHRYRAHLHTLPVRLLAARIAVSSLEYLRHRHPPTPMLLHNRNQKSNRRKKSQCLDCLCQCRAPLTVRRKKEQADSASAKKPRKQFTWRHRSHAVLRTEDCSRAGIWFDEWKAGVVAARESTEESWWCHS